MMVYCTCGRRKSQRRHMDMKEVADHLSPLPAAEGALDGVSGISGMHVWPTLPSGTIASKVQRQHDSLLSTGVVVSC